MPPKKKTSLVQEPTVKKVEGRQTILTESTEEERVNLGNASERLYKTDSARVGMSFHSSTSQNNRKELLIDQHL